MSIQILNNGASLKIIRDGVSRLVLKTQIKDVSASGTNLKIETCGCGSPCLFFPFAEITSPVVVDVTALRDAVNEMLNTTIEGGSLTIEGFSTELKQAETLTKIQEVKTTLQDASTQIQLVIANGFVGKSTEARQTETLTKLDNMTAQLLDALAGVSGGEGAATDASVLLVKLAVETLTATLPAMLDVLKAGLATESKQMVIVESLTELYDQLNTLVTLTVGQTTDLTNALSGKATEAKQIEMLAKLQEIKIANEDTGLSVTAKLEEKFEAPAATNATLLLVKAAVEAGNALVTTLSLNLPGLFADLKAGASTEAQQIDILNKLNETKTAVEDVAIFIMGKLDEVMDGKATAAKQDTQTTELENIKAGINNLRTDVQNAFSNDYRFAAPLRMDTEGITVYKGFAAAGTTNVDALWAIQRITSTGEGNQTIEWAGGNRNFINLWADRAILIYS